MKKCTDPSFKYTPVAQQGPDYLAKKFQRMLKEQAKVKAEQVAKLRSISILKRKA
jgi:hypothetical protein